MEGKIAAQDGRDMIDKLLELVRTADAAPAPKYQVLRDSLVRAISYGHWKPGEKLPTEVELAGELPYSLGTVQKAYSLLVEEGLIVRRRGRGSFVAPSRGQMPEPWHCRFLDEHGEVLPVYPRLLGHSTLRADTRWHRILGTADVVVCLDRLISINHEFDVLSRFYARTDIAAPLLKLAGGDGQTANYKAVLLRELHLPIARIRQSVAVVDREAAENAPLLADAPTYLIVEATAYARDGSVAYFQEITIPQTNRRLLFESNLKTPRD